MNVFYCWILSFSVLFLVSHLFSHVFCLQDYFIIRSHPFFLWLSCLWSRTGWQQLHILGAACAGRPGDPGEGLLIGWGQVDHEEHPIWHILFRAAAGKLAPAAAQGGQQLTVPLRVLQIFQGDHIGQIQLPIQTEAPPAPTDQKAKDAHQKDEEGSRSYDDVGDGSGADDGFTWTLTLRARHS